MYEVHRLKNPIKRMNWLVIGGVSAAVGVMVWLVERHSAASGPVTSLTTGSRYQLVGQVPAGVDPIPYQSTLQASYAGAGPGGAQWKDIAVTVSGNMYTVQATYLGPGTPVPAGLVVTKIG
jgi:hypothetical protein